MFLHLQSIYSRDLLTGNLELNLSMGVHVLDWWMGVVTFHEEKFSEELLLLTI